MYNTKALIQATKRIKQHGKERQPNMVSGAEPLESERGASNESYLF